MLALFIPLALAFVVAVCLVPVIRMIGFKVGYVVKPREDRWHRKPTPTLGGVAIATTVLLLASTHVDGARLWVLLLGAGVIFLVGLVDDLISLKPYTKLIAEIAVASLFVFFGFRLNW